MNSSQMIKIRLSFLTLIFVVCLLKKILILYLLLGFLILLSINITLETIFQKVSNINISKSPALDGWPPVVLRETAGSITCSTLSSYYIFTKSLKAGSLLTGWKKGCVMPIYKKGLRHLVQNY